MLNFQLLFNFSLTFSAFIFLITLFSFKTYETSYFFNIVYKIVLDEFYFSNFYYIWNNFSIMFILFTFIFFIIFSFKNTNSYNNIVTLFLVLNFLFYFNLIDYFFLNSCLFDYDMQLKNYNVLLNNSINKIHPILLYSSVFFLSYSIFLNNLYFKYTHVNYTFIKFMYRLLSSLTLLVFTLFLGSWWAFQEGSWGGWWDWDISEVFGLFILINILKLFHDKSLTMSHSNYKFSLNTYFQTLMIFYLFMQLNFSLISHNFNLHVLSNFISNYSYVLFIIFLLLNNILAYRQKYKLYNKLIVDLRVFLNLNQYVTLVLILIITASLIVLFSTFYVLSNWIWSNFYISYSVGLIDFNYMINTVLLFVISIYWDFKFIYIFVFTLLTYNNLTIGFLITSSILLYSTYVSHYFLYLFLVLNFIYKSTESSFWTHFNPGFNESLYYFYNPIKVELPMLNSSKLILTDELSINKNFNWWYDFSISDFKSFELYLNSNCILQNLIHDSDVNTFLVCISSLPENSLVICFLIPFFSFNYFKFKKSIIVF